MIDLPSMEASETSEDHEEEGGATKENTRCTLNGKTQDNTNETQCTALVPYRKHPCFELSWEADSSWSV